MLLWCDKKSYSKFCKRFKRIGDVPISIYCWWALEVPGKPCWCGESQRKSGESFNEIVKFIVEAHSKNVLSLEVFNGNRKEFEFELELFVAGLKIFLGEDRPLVAQEIFEVGKDIADRIRTKQAELANPSDITTP
jgi:hypothetical protein